MASEECLLGWTGQITFRQFERHLVLGMIALEVFDVHQFGARVTIDEELVLRVVLRRDVLESWQNGKVLCHLFLPFLLLGLRHFQVLPHEEGAALAVPVSGARVEAFRVGSVL